MAICCLLLVALSAWLRSRLGVGARPDSSSALQQRSSWLLWGAALGGLGYLGLVQIALSANLALHTDAGAWCAGSTGAPAAVPYEWIASRWLLRSLLLLTGCIALLGAALHSLRRHDRPEPEPGLVLAGGAGMLLALSLVDHHGFGLYAFRAQTPLPYFLLHAFSALAILCGIRSAQSRRPTSAARSAAAMSLSESWARRSDDIPAPRPAWPCDPRR